MSEERDTDYEVIEFDEELEFDDEIPYDTDFDGIDLFEEQDDEDDLL